MNDPSLIRKRREHFLKVLRESEIPRCEGGLGKACLRLYEAPEKELQNEGEGCCALGMMFMTFINEFDAEDRASIALNDYMDIAQEFLIEKMGIEKGRRTYADEEEAELGIECSGDVADIAWVIFEKNDAGESFREIADYLERAFKHNPV